MEYIKLNSLFLSPTSYDSEPVEIGSTKRTTGGHIYTQTTAKYMKFNIVLEGLEPSMHSNLLYLVSLNRNYDGTASENLSFTDYVGNNYTVAIPKDGYDFNLEQGKEETYRWEIDLEEVL
jgi:hypothetical protein